MQQGRMEPVNPLKLNPKRVAFAGDWHGNLPWAQMAVSAAKSAGADVIVHVGDFGYLFHPVFLTRLTQSLAMAGIPLMFVDGNHDNHSLLARTPVTAAGLREMTSWIWHIPRGFRWKWRGVRFVGLGGAHSVDASRRRSEGWPWWPQEQITRTQAVRVTQAGPTDVLVAHDCPDGVYIPGLDPHGWPRFELDTAQAHRRLLGRVAAHITPRVVVHGHYHVRYRDVVDLGYGPVLVQGLDCDGTSTEDNLHVVNVVDLLKPHRLGGNGK